MNEEIKKLIFMLAGRYWWLTKTNFVRPLDILIAIIVLPFFILYKILIFPLKILSDIINS